MPPPLYTPNHFYDRNKAGLREDFHKMNTNHRYYSSCVSSHPHHNTHSFNSSLIPLSSHPSQYEHHPNYHPIPVHHNHYSNHPPSHSVSYHGFNGSQSFNGNDQQENIHPTYYSNNGEYHGWNPLPPNNGYPSWNPPPPYKQYSDHNGSFNEEMYRGDGGRRGEKKERREGSVDDQMKNSQFEKGNSRRRFNSKGDSYSSSSDPGGLTEWEKKEFTALIQDLWSNQRFAQEFKKYNVGAYIHIRDLLEKMKEKEDDEKERRDRRSTRR